MSRVASRVRPPKTRLIKIMVPVALVVVTVVAVSFFVVPEADLAELDRDLCPLSATDIAGHVVVLLDVGKPLAANAGLPAGIIGRVTDAMDRQTELRVMALESGPTAELRLLGRLCKPFSNDQLTVTAAKDNSPPLRDCNDLPAQLPPNTRASAGEFCRLRDDLFDRVTTLALASASGEPVRDVHLIEGIEESLLNLAGRSRPSLHILSDMIQHAPWHSHVELVPRDWTMAVLADARDRRDAPMPVELPAIADLAVTIHYMARQGLTDKRRIATGHKAFWREFFAASAGSLRIEDEPAVLAYETVRYGPSAEEIAAMEAERARLEREETQRLRDRLAAEAAALEEGRRAADQARAEAVAARRAAEERAAELQRQTDELQAEAARLEAQRLEAQRLEGERRDLALGQEPGSAQPQTAPAPRLPNPQQPGSAGDAQPAPVGDVPRSEQQSAPDVPALPTLDLPENAATGSSPVVAASVEACVAARTNGLPDDLYPQPLSSWLRRRGQRVDYGSADVVVDYTIGPDGRVTDAAINDKASRAEQPRYMNLFAMVAVDTVTEWTFTFDEIDGCERSQSRSVVLQFRYPGSP